MEMTRDLLHQLTVEEKAALLSGVNFMETNPIPRLGIPALCMADGPHGLRKQIGTADNGISQSEPATAFPTAAAVASSWNPKNAERMGKAIAEECRHYGVNILLGPGVNIKRNPRCGRNFEYYSEDPLLSGTLGAAFVRGVQGEGVGVSVKHFAANNSENFRFMGASILDERTLREIYLRAFEQIVREAKPWTMMCAYNRIDGIYCSENKRLLTGILREEWGFDGAVMTDWGAARDRVAGVIAGLELEMPGDTAHCRAAIIEAAENGSLPKRDLDTATERVLTLIDRSHRAEKGTSFDQEAHHKLAADIVMDSAVLMQNGGALPLGGNERLLVCGELFEKMRYQGAGSSMISPTKLTTPKNAFDAHHVEYGFAMGYRENTEMPDDALIREAVRAAENCDTILIFCGLTDYTESEGCDRQHLRLPENQLGLIEALISTGKKIVLVLYGGAPVELPFADGVDAILNMYLPGQNGGEATWALLYGKVNPSGKLAETWPLRQEDVPFDDSFAQSIHEVYREGIFVGYRYYDTAGQKVRFPFGHGLSYTSFSYAGLAVAESDGIITVTCDITNTGTLDGAEVVQLYVRNGKSPVFKAAKELRAFAKLYLKAGETKQAILRFRRHDLAYYNMARKEWVLDNGEYTLEVGASSAQALLTLPYVIAGEPEAPSPYDAQVSDAYSKLTPFAMPDAVMEQLLGAPLPELPPALPLHVESRFSDFRQTAFGRILNSAVLGVATKQHKAALKMPEGQARDNRLKGAIFLKRILDSNSVRTFSMSAGKAMPYNFALGFVEIGNGRLLRGLRCIMKRTNVPPLPKDKNQEGV